jgi:hypothetical protein
MKQTDDYYVEANGRCQKLDIDVDGRFFRDGAEVTTGLAVCQQPGSHPHHPRRHPQTPTPPKARR